MKKWKRTAALLMAAALAASCVPAAFAQTVEEIEPVGPTAWKSPIFGAEVGKTVYTPDGTLYDLSGNAAKPLVKGRYVANLIYQCDSVVDANDTLWKYYNAKLCGSVEHFQEEGSGGGYALTTDGTLFDVGYWTRPSDPIAKEPLLRSVTKVTGSLAMQTDGSVYCLSQNGCNKVLDGAKDIIGTYAIKPAGTAWKCGYNKAEKLLDHVADIHSGNFLQEDGTVWRFIWNGVETVFKPVGHAVRLQEQGFVTADNQFVRYWGDDANYAKLSLNDVERRDGDYFIMKDGTTKAYRYTGHYPNQKWDYATVLNAPMQATAYARGTYWYQNAEGNTTEYTTGINWFLDTDGKLYKKIDDEDLVEPVDTQGIVPETLYAIGEYPNTIAVIEADGKQYFLKNLQQNAKLIPLDFFVKSIQLPDWNDETQVVLMDADGTIWSAALDDAKGIVLQNKLMTDVQAFKTWESGALVSRTDGSVWKGQQADGSQAYTWVKMLDAQPPAPAFTATDPQTGVLIEAAEGMLPANAKAVVKQVNAGEDFETAQKALAGKAEDFVLYDISLWMDDAKIQPNGKITVQIPLPQGMTAQRCGVVRIEADGTLTDMNAEIVGESARFETDHFSLYAVVNWSADMDDPQGTQQPDGDGQNAQPSQPTQNPAMGDAASLAAAVALAAACGAALTLRRKKTAV